MRDEPKERHIWDGGYSIMSSTPQHAYQLITIRPHRAREVFAWQNSATSGHLSMVFDPDGAWPFNGRRGAK